MAQQESITLLQFQNNFSEENACRKHLFKHRWPEGFCCPKCGHSEYYYLEKSVGFTRNITQCFGLKNGCNSPHLKEHRFCHQQ